MNLEKNKKKKDRKVVPFSQDSITYTIYTPVVKYKGQVLTEKQLAILELIGEGYCNQDIAAIMELSPRTVESHTGNLRNILSKDTEKKMNDRKMVLLAKEMLEGYKYFLNLRAQKISSQGNLFSLNTGNTDVTANQTATHSANVSYHFFGEEEITEAYLMAA